MQTVNSDLVDKENELRALFHQAQDLYAKGAPPDDFRKLLAKINAVRAEINTTSETWRDTITRRQTGEGYALWNQPQTTVEQLIIDFGSQEYVYIIPPDLGQIKIGVASTIPVPRALWSEMLELVLAQAGVGVRQLNPYLRVIYPLRQNQSGLQLITNNPADLEYLPANARVGFFISPDPSEVRRVGFFLERFINPNTTTMQMVGRDMLIVSTVAEIKELLKLYEFVSKTRGVMEYRLVPLVKVDTEEMAKVLQAMFEQFSQEEAVYQTADKKGGGGTAQAPKVEGHGLKVIPLKDVARAVFLVGTREEIERAESIIQEVESQVGSAREKVVYTYHVKHSDPEELAEVLAKIYELLVTEGIGREQQQQQVTEITKGPNGEQTKVITGPAAAAAPPQTPPQINIISNQQRQIPGMYHNPFPTVVDDTPGFYQNGQVTINPTPIASQPFVFKEPNLNRNNFLVDPRSSTIVMVLDPWLLPRMKALIRRIDQPPAMVQLDVLLVEYRDKHTNNYGLNLLSIGGLASQQRRTAFRFDDIGQITGSPLSLVPTLAEGVTEILVSRPHTNSNPAFDVIYRFLMTQEDASVNANPSVVTINREECSIQIKQEISISTGIVEVVGTNQNVGPKDAFTRAQYGTDIRITPTIHTKGDDPEELWDDSPDYVTLKSSVLFDDVLPSVDPTRPDILRRLVENIVRVADGQTVILGGLKRQDIDDSKQMIPFIGEVPYLGKAFSKTEMSDSTTEMFIFITPTIIYDQCAGVEKVKRDQFFRRPGDIPHFLCALDEARHLEQERCYALGMEMIFGRERNECVEWGDDACEHPRSRGYQGKGNRHCPVYLDARSNGKANVNSCIW